MSWDAFLEVASATRMQGIELYDIGRDLFKGGNVFRLLFNIGSITDDRFFLGLIVNRINNVDMVSDISENALAYALYVHYLLDISESAAVFAVAYYLLCKDFSNAL